MFEFDDPLLPERCVADEEEEDQELISTTPKPPDLKRFVREVVSGVTCREADLREGLLRVELYTRKEHATC